MDIGTPVTYYTHQHNGQEHTTDDSLAYVLRDRGEGVVDVVVFPVGGPTRYATVREFDPDRDFQTGGEYYRSHGSKAPDFSSLNYVDKSEFVELRRRHKAELEGIRDPEKRKEIEERQRVERENLITEFDRRYAPKEEKKDA